MKYFVFLLVLLFSSSLVYAQEYNFDEKKVIDHYKKFAKSNELMREVIPIYYVKKNYVDALPLLKEIYDLRPSIAGELSLCYFYLNKKEEALKYAKVAIERYWNLTPYENVFSNDSSLLLELKQYYDSLDNKGLIIRHEIDTMLSEKLSLMYEKDVAIRTKHLDYLQGNTEEDLESIMYKMVQVDNENIEFLKEYAFYNGYPNKDNLLKGTSQNNHIFLKHTDIANVIYFLPIVKYHGISNSDWYPLGSAMYQLTMRLSENNNNKKNKLIYVKNKKDGVLDIDNSFIQLYATISYANQNPGIVYEFFVYDIEGINPALTLENLQKIKNLFLEFGVEENKVIINEELQPGHDDFLSQYRSPYGFYIHR